jgi:putative DNA primase/helicase
MGNLVKISVCNRRTDKKYKNQEQTWDYIVNRNRTPIRTSETVEEYPKLPKAQRDSLKDIGGFVGGWLKGGIRKNGNIISRSIGVLDADSIPKGIDFLAVTAAALSGVKYFIYSTHSHIPEAPRFRLVILFAREVSEDVYPALMRMVARKIGIDYFVNTTI